jgi:hypothetical protein
VWIVNNWSHAWGDEPSVEEAPYAAGALDFLVDDGTDSAHVGFPTLMFTTTSPDGSISVTATFAGRLHHVQLSAAVVSKTEVELVTDILPLARLAQRRALAAQHAIISELLVKRGHDPAGTRAWLENTLKLPSPQTVQEEGAAVFAQYSGYGG